MYPMPQPPRSPYYPAPRRGVPDWVVVVISVTVVMCLLLGVGVGILLFRTRQPGSVAQTLPASVGQSLIINNVTVTLVSATLVRSMYSVEAAGDVPGINFSLHFWNQTTYSQSASTDNWSLLADNGAKSYPVSPLGYVFALLAPNQTKDARFAIPMGVGDNGPYTLQTDFTTPQGQPLAWTFSG